jgi:hypothetical protein
MAIDPDPAGMLFWKFIAYDRSGAIWWVWQVWTQAGHFVATSDRQFDTLTECERDAKANGYVAPEQRVDD